MVCYEQSQYTRFPTVYPTIYHLNENFEYGYPHSNALLQFALKLKRCKQHQDAHHPTICDIINDVKQFPTVYSRIYCDRFLALSNQTSCYKRKCIRMDNSHSSRGLKFHKLTKSVTIGVASITQYMHMLNKNSNTQGSSPNVVKVIFHT